MADGNITAAATKLTRAVDRLCKPRMAVYHDQIRYALSLYRQLQEDLPGKKGDSRTPAKSLPPLWIDAAQLRIDMDLQTRNWYRKERGIPQRLGALAATSWRPQDTEHVTDMARTVDMWCETILHLLDPESVKHISAPCPSCGRSFIYVQRDGESLRQPALKVVTNVGASCQHCDAHWAPDRYMILCRLLGFDLPEGVLE